MNAQDAATKRQKLQSLHDFILRAYQDYVLIGSSICLILHDCESGEEVQALLLGGGFEFGIERLPELGKDLGDLVTEFEHHQDFFLRAAQASHQPEVDHSAHRSAIAALNDIRVSVEGILPIQIPKGQWLSKQNLARISAQQLLENYKANTGNHSARLWKQTKPNSYADRLEAAIKAEWAAGLNVLAQEEQNEAGKLHGEKLDRLLAMQLTTNHPETNQEPECKSPSGRIKLFGVSECPSVDGKPLPPLAEEKYKFVTYIISHQEEIRGPKLTDLQAEFESANKLVHHFKSTAPWNSVFVKCEGYGMGYRFI